MEVDIAVKTNFTEEEIYYYKGKVQDALLGMAMSDIRRTKDAGISVGTFILCCCLIHAASAYRCGKPSTGGTFNKFLKLHFNHLNSRYLGSGLYEALRCGLLHAYLPTSREEEEETETETETYFMLGNNIGDMHLDISEEIGKRRVYIDLDAFVRDTEAAMNHYFESVGNNKNGKRLASHAYRTGWLEVREHSIFDKAGNFITLAATGPNMSSGNSISDSNVIATDLDQTITEDG